MQTTFADCGPKCARVSRRGSAMRPRYQANRGGHAPGYLREALIECLDRWQCGSSENWYDALADEGLLVLHDEAKSRAWEQMDTVRRAKWLIGQLWNCTDALPGSNCDALDLAGYGTYAAAVRKLNAELPA